MTTLTSKEAYLLTDTKAEASVLRSLSFWSSKAKTKKNGFVWMIKIGPRAQHAMTVEKEDGGGHIKNLEYVMSKVKAAN